MAKSWGETLARLVDRRIAAPVATTAAITAIPASQRADGQVVLETTGGTSWWFDSDSAVPAGPGVLVPDAGSGRWLAVGAASSGVGLPTMKSVRTASTGALPAYTRVGNVITANANGAIGAQDGVAPALTNRFMLMHGAAGADNGIYQWTALGGAGAPWSLTRVGDADASAEVVAGMFVFVSEGTANGNEWWFLSTNDPITLNTTALTFTQVPPLVDMQSADTSLTTRISTEESTSLSADTSLTTRLSTEESTSLSADTSQDTRVSTEESTRLSADTSLTTADTSLTTRLSTEESTSLSADTSQNTRISTEESTSLSADTSLTTRLSTEESTSLSADTSQDVRVSTEESTRLSADTSLTTADTSLTTRISTEESTSLSADTSLTTRLSTEESTSLSADTSQDTRVSTEESTRASADTSLTTRVSTEEAARTLGDVTLRPGLPMQNRLRLLGAPGAAVEGNTVTIGANVFEFRSSTPPVGGTAGRIWVYNGANSAASRTNLIDAINGVIDANRIAYDGALTETFLAAAGVTTGDIIILSADTAGGTAIPSATATATTETLDTATDIWDEANCYGGTATAGTQAHVITITLAAAHIAKATIQATFDFTPLHCMVLNRSRPQNEAYTIVGNAISLTLAGAGSPNNQAGDVVDFLAFA